MRRRDFLKMLGAGAAAAAAAPLLTNFLVEDPPYPLKPDALDLSDVEMRGVELNRLIATARGRNTSNAVKSLLAHIEQLEQVDSDIGQRRGEMTIQQAMTPRHRSRFGNTYWRVG